MREVAAGLEAAKDLKPGTGYVTALGGWAQLRGPFAMAELGAHLGGGHKLFARAEADRQDQSVVAGWRWDF